MSHPKDDDDETSLGDHLIQTIGSSAFETASVCSSSDESTAAIVSLYNSWSSSSCSTVSSNSQGHTNDILSPTTEIEAVVGADGYALNLIDIDDDDIDDDTLTMDCQFSLLPLLAENQHDHVHDLHQDVMWDELRKRLPSPQDHSPRMSKRQRRRPPRQPICRFVNFLGTRLPATAPLQPTPPPPTPQPVTSPVDPWNELGLDEKDPLFPLAVSSRETGCPDGCDDAVVVVNATTAESSSSTHEPPETGREVGQVG
ncbi:hypothetical protein ACA910_012698 [Epithemia clementina (nom. ined.)]